MPPNGYFKCSPEYSGTYLTAALTEATPASLMEGTGGEHAQLFDSVLVTIYINYVWGGEYVHFSTYNFLCKIYYINRPILYLRLSGNIQFEMIYQRNYQ